MNNDIDYIEAWNEPDEAESLAAEQAELNATLQMFGVRLMRLAKEQITAKADIEARWLEDLRAYHSKYDDKTSKRIEKNGGSSVYVGITRHKCNTAEARLIDMLFPNDDRNWSISATPLPELAEASESEVIMQMPDGTQIPERDIAQQKMQDANRKSKGMQTKIEDQLVQANYSAKCRDSIHDAVILGTGIIKAPVVEGRTSKQWDTLPDGTSVLTITESLEPTVEVVSPWDYFPDMSARNKSEVAFEFERKFLTKQQVRELLKLPNVLIDEVLSVLRDDEASATQDDRFTEIREISGDNVNTNRNRYEMWEYHGEIEAEELEAVGMDADDGVGVTGTVLLLNGRVIRVSLNPLETEDSPYSVFCWENDNSSIFGFGVPYLVRSPQSMINAATRMMMDNARLSVAPQVVMNKKLVTPADGSWVFEPFKRWYVNDDSMPINQAMQFFNVPSNQSDLSAIYQLGRFLIDEQSSLPAVATGEGDPNAAAQTATGVAIQSGAAKVVFKRVVKNFDDDLTVPTIRRFYHWNMQYSNDASIKGDMQVNPRGSSTLMVREQEAALMSDVLKMIDPREIAMRIKPAEAIAEFFKTRSINASEILKSEEEYQADVARMQEQAAQQGQQGDPVMAKLQMQAQIEQMKLQQKEMQMQMDVQRYQIEAQQKEQQMQMQYEIEMSKLAAQQQTTVEKLKLDSGAIQTRQMLEQMKEQNRKEIADMQLATQRQIAAIRAQQESNKQAMQNMNLQAGYDTF